MTFTTTPPTKPGFYAWRLKPTHNSSMEKLHIDELDGQLRTREGFLASDCGGEWCRLVPAEEVERAYKEGYADFGTKTIEEDKVCAECWPESRARRVMEGEI